jgi:hypothetical protein
MMKTFWLSFCDGARPQGQQFIGVAVVDVTEEEADEAALSMPRGDRWVIAACQKAWRDGCNPGGQMLSDGIPDAPRSRLMQMPELKSLGLI